MPYPRTHILEIASHRCKLRGCSSLCCTNKANGILPQNARNAQNLLAEKSLPQMQAQGVQQSLLHQQSKRYPPTERTERTESSCREEPPTDGTDQHRSFVGGYGILPYPRTHIHEIASHRWHRSTQMLSQGVQQSLLHQQSKRCPPTDSTDLHRCRRVWHPAIPTQFLTPP